MNKPLAIVCFLIAAPGLVILSCVLYFCIRYGQGDLEAGNFHRYIYSVRHDAVTGRTHRTYHPRWENTEQPLLAEFLNMWAIGIGLPVLAGWLYAADSWSGQRRFP